MRNFRFLSVLLILGLLLFSCSSDKKDNGTNQQEEPPQGVAIEPIQLPASMMQSSDANVQIVVSYVNLLNTFQYWIGSLTPQGQVGKVGYSESATDGPPWIYSWTEQGLTVTLTITIENNQYHWVLTFTGTEEGIQYNNAKILEAWEDVEGTSGRIVYYEPSDQSKLGEWSWQKDNNTTTVKYVSYLDQIEITLVQNADLSGSLEVKENSVLTFKAQWNADGSGQWWTYDENGSQTGTGTWT